MISSADVQENKPSVFDDTYYDEEYYDEQEDTESMQVSEIQIKHPKYKTVMCRNIVSHGECNFDGCTFAHSDKELRKPQKNTGKVTSSKFFD